MKVQISHVLARDHEHAYAVALPEIEPGYVEPFSPLCFVCAIDVSGKTPKWTFQEIEQSIAKLFVFDDPDTRRSSLASMSHDGEFTRYLPSGNIVEQVPEAGLKDETNSHGRVFSGRQIGRRVFCCGDGGQFAVREHEGSWAFLAKEKRTSIDDITKKLPPRPSWRDAAAFAEYAVNPNSDPETYNLRYTNLNGISEKSIYICAQMARKGLIYFWDGYNITNIDNPSSEIINGFHIESKERVWAYGRNGTLLTGNRHDGFRDVSRSSDNEWLVGIESLEGQKYLASSADRAALLMLDENDRQTAVPNVPSTNSVNSISAADGSLWIADTYSLLRYDGRKWEKFVHPQNV